MALLYSALGKPQEALALIEQTISLQKQVLGADHPQTLRSMENRAAILDHQGAYSPAESALREIVQLKPDDEIAHYDLGRILQHQGKYEEADAAFREALRVDPNYVAAYDMLGISLLEQGKYEEAVAACREAIRIQPNDAQAHYSLGVALIKQARAARHTPPWDDAAAEIARVIDLLKEQHTDRAKSLCDMAQWDELYSRVCKLRPDEPMVWNGRAQSLALRGHWEESRKYYAKVIEGVPVDNNETTDYAYLLVLLGDHDGFQQYCQSLVDRAGKSTDTEVAFHFARVCGAGPCTAVDSSQVVEWAEVAARSSTKAWYPHVLGLAQYRAGRYEAAIENLKKSNAIDWNINQHQVPKSLNWLVLAMAHFRLEHSDEARQFLATAKTIIDDARPKNPHQPVELEACDWIPMQVLLRKAESLLKGDGATNSPKP